jgi:ferrochelatase
VVLEGANTSAFTQFSHDCAPKVGKLARMDDHHRNTPATPDQRRGILLVNLGTPRSPSVPDVRRYLKEFLMDPYVIDAPWPVRKLIVSLFVLPFRPKKSAHAYASIWDEVTGSPLLHESQLLQLGVANQSNLPCALAMRYGEPSIEQGLAELQAQGVHKVLLVALYPHHADSTRTTTIERTQALLPAGMSLTTLPPFYSDPDYISALASSLKPHLAEPFDHLLLSYHGLPERHLTVADPTGNHCLASPTCCDDASPAHATCYRHQILETSKHLQQALQVPEEKLSISFQSRLGRLPWLTPYTDVRLAELAASGVERLVVACPAFVADNLETLEEMGLQGRQTFEDAGGKALTLVPCLNASEQWVQTLSRWCTGVSEPANAQIIASSAASLGLGPRP